MGLGGNNQSCSLTFCRRVQLPQDEQSAGAGGKGKDQRVGGAGTTGTSLPALPAFPHPNVNFLKCLIGAPLICNVVLVSSVQQSAFFFTSFSHTGF